MNATLKDYLEIIGDFSFLHPDVGPIFFYPVMYIAARISAVYTGRQIKKYSIVMPTLITWCIFVFVITEIPYVRKMSTIELVAISTVMGFLSFDVLGKWNSASIVDFFTKRLLKLFTDILKIKLEIPDEATEKNEGGDSNVNKKTDVKNDVEKTTEKDMSQSETTPQKIYTNQGFKRTK